MKNILLISAYDAVSHRYWRNGLTDYFQDYEWTELILPPRYFNWRLTGNPLSLYSAFREELNKNYDLLIATSMTNLATLKGLTPHLAQTPTLVYFHENQFAYPGSEHQKQDPVACMINIYNIMAADQAVFNSQYNLNTLLNGSKALMSKMPDFQISHIDKLLQEKCSVIPVPLDNSLFNLLPQPKADEFTVVWNHRWEYDKAPERLYNALMKVKESGTPFRLHLIGQQFRQQPDVFNAIKSAFSDEINTLGYIESREDYLSLLQQSHVVVSTAIHEFQGLALLEAITCGCIPLAPDRLAYADYLSDQHLYRSDIDSPEIEANYLADAILNYAKLWSEGMLPTAPSVSNFSWQTLGKIYQTSIDQLMKNN